MNRKERDADDDDDDGAGFKETQNIFLKRQEKSIEKCARMFAIYCSIMQTNNVRYCTSFNDLEAYNQTLRITWRI
jgi:hypothetical protein